MIIEEYRGYNVDMHRYVYGMFCKQKIGNLFLPCIQVLKESDYEDYLDYYEIIPESIGMYFGKKDKNGFKIYTGDYVIVPSGKNKYGVLFKSYKGKVIFNGENIKIEHIDNYGFQDYKFNELEIYDNGEHIYHEF